MRKEKDRKLFEFTRQFRGANSIQTSEDVAI